MPARFAGPVHAARLGTEAVDRLTDDLGIVRRRDQPAVDYSTDDNARALILAVRANGIDDAQRRRWTQTYAGFVDEAWNASERTSRGRRAADRHWLDERGSEESVGRAVWALGVTAAEAEDKGLRDWALQAYERALEPALNLESLRAQASMMLGGAALLTVRDHPPTRAMLQRFGDHLACLVARERRPDWAWFEIVLGEDNYRLPEALIRAGRVLGRDDLVATGLETLDWIFERQAALAGPFRPVGTESAGQPYAPPRPFDQQSFETWSAIDACAAAFEATGNSRWRERALAAWAWFLGDNDAGQALADPRTGDCADGLAAFGVLPGRSAEAVLSFQLSALTITSLSTAESRLDLAAA